MFATGYACRRFEFHIFLECGPISVDVHKRALAVRSEGRGRALRAEAAAGAGGAHPVGRRAGEGHPIRHRAHPARRWIG